MATTTSSEPQPLEITWLGRPQVLTYYLYLPVAFKAPVGFINGNFEQGRNVGWTESTKTQCGSDPCPLVVDQFPTGVSPYEGNWAAWLGGANNETSELSQSVDIGNQSGLSVAYYHRIESREVSCIWDYGYLEINGSEIAGTRVDLCEDNERGWQRKVVPLSGYSGIVTIKFIVETDDSVNSNYFIDNVSLL
jgi:hypothetical protein